jgi:hypothetical protein
MDRTAVFIDAGYLFAQGSVLLTGEKLPRGELLLDNSKVLEVFAALATSLSSLPLLRIYWYDGTAIGPTPQQLALAYKPNVKLRLGFVNQHGEQKGVDSLIVTDMIDLARNRAMTDAVLLTGDEDIRVGVQQAQAFGVRVHLVGIEPARGNQSGFLVQEADSVRELKKDEVSTFLSRSAPRTQTPAPTPLRSNSPLASVAEELAGQLTAEEVDAILKDSTGGSVPAEIDRRLLRKGSEISKTQLESAQKRLLRTTFLEACRARQ